MAIPQPPATKVPILSTAGAISLRDEKGQLYTEKVKVQRYVTGKRPDYAPADDSDSEEELEFGLTHKKPSEFSFDARTLNEKEDRRLQRLNRLYDEENEEGNEEVEEDEDAIDRVHHRRRLHEPELMENSDEELVEDEEEDEEEEPQQEKELDEIPDNELKPIDEDYNEEEDDDEEELDDEEIERRRGLLRQKALQQKEEEQEVLEKEDEKSEEDSEEESSEYEEYTDSEEEETGPRLKPVFVRRKDRVTIQEKEKQEQKARDDEVNIQKQAEDRRQQTLQMVAEEARKEANDARNLDEKLDAVITDEENDEEEYEAWKIRELKRIKRDREERENIEKEKQEIDRLHNMTEEERKMELRNNPKLVTNKASKGKYKFLQKYYHRGSFFMGDEEDVYKRDFSAPTLEDHFDKTILPKVMQVKNFGRSGRTKYTHLVDQDTTVFDSSWMDTALSHKFSTTKAGGMKQDFVRPSLRKGK